MILYLIIFIKGIYSERMDTNYGQISLKGTLITFIMPRSKCLHYNDEQLRILICIAGFGPFSRTDLSEVTGIKHRNLAHAINDLLENGDLKPIEVPERISRNPGRQKEYLTLTSIWIVRRICDELEFRKNRLKAAMEELDSRIIEKNSTEGLAKLNENERKAFLDEWGEAMLKRLSLGAEDGSYSSKAAWEDVDGQRTIVVQRYDGVLYSVREVSYLGVIYWLWRLQNPALRVLSFLLDNGSADYSKNGLVEGTGLEMDVLSQMCKRLESDGLIILAGMSGQEEMYKLNRRNPVVKKLMTSLCLWKGKSKTGIGLRGIAIQKSIPSSDHTMAREI